MLTVNKTQVIKKNRYLLVIDFAMIKNAFSLAEKQSPISRETEEEVQEHRNS